MSALSSLPDTGVFVVKNGQWVESVDPQVGVNGVWREAFEVDVQSAGTWKRAYLRPISVTIAITSDPVTDKIAGIDALAGTYTGTMLDVLDRGVTGDLTVTLFKDGVEQSSETVTVTNGVWSYSFDLGMSAVGDIGEWHHTFTFADDPPLVGASSTAPSFQVNSASVQVTILTQPSGNLDKGYDSFALSGVARREDGSAAPGTISLYMPDDTQTGLTRLWETQTIDADGRWAFPSNGPSGLFGRRRITLRYEPLAGGFEDPTTVYGNTITYVPRATTFSKGSVGETSIAMSCADRQASGYQFYEGSTQRYSGSSRSYTRTGLKNYTQYSNWKVRSYGTSPGGTAYYSAFSSQHSARTGRPEKRDSGSKSNMVFAPSKTGSHRDVDGWSYLGDKVGQGTWGTYGSYRGIIDFGGGNAIRDSLRSKLGGDGTARQKNGSCTKCEVYLYKRTGVGSSGVVKVKIGRSSTAVGGGRPGTGAGTVTRDTTNSGSGKWIGITTSNGNVLGSGDGTSRSLVIHNDGTGNYAQFTGKSGGGNNCRLRMSWSWNYVTQSKANGTWLS